MLNFGETLNLIISSMKKLFIFTVLVMFGLCASAQKFEPEWVSEVNILKIDGDTVAIPTEKSVPQIKTSSSAGRILVGIGNVRSKAVFKNGRSTAQIQPGDMTTLVVRAKDNDTDPATFIQIVKFEEKKKERKTELAKENWVGNVSEGNMKLIQFKGKRYGKSSYILTFQAPEGEYGVRVLNPNVEDEKVAVFYCFGIHGDSQK